jgi:hypothetical protein
VAACTSLNVTATAGSGSLNKVELFDGATLLTTFFPIGVTTYVASYAWTPTVAGQHTLTVRATNTLGTFVTSAPVNVSVAAGQTVPPTVSITAPANNAKLAKPDATHPSITIRVSADGGSGTVSNIDILDGSTVLISNPISGSPATATFDYGWANTSVGSHVLTARITNSQGASLTSTPVSVTILAAPVVSLGTLSNFNLAGSTVDVYATAAPAVGSTASITTVEYFANNGTTNTLIGTQTSAPFSLRWASVAAGSYSLTARATDSEGISTVSAPVTITVGTAVSIQFAAGINGSTVNDDTVLVSGTVNAPPNSGVIVNGQLATVTADGQFFLNDLYLAPGANAVTATVTTPDSQTATNSISVNRQGTAAADFRVSTDQSEVLVIATEPAQIAVTVENLGSATVVTVLLSCEAGAIPIATVLGISSCAYSTPGAKLISVSVRDNGGTTIYAKTIQINVKSAIAHDRMMRSVYFGMLERLQSGNINGALNSLTTSIYDRFSTFFYANSSNLAVIVDGLGVLSQVRASADLTELTIVRSTADGAIGYFVYLIRAEDGIWRIDGM